MQSNTLKKRRANIFKFHKLNFFLNYFRESNFFNKILLFYTIYLGSFCSEIVNWHLVLLKLDIFNKFILCLLLFESFQK